jgi:hypothetical protein
MEGKVLNMVIPGITGGYTSLYWRLYKGTSRLYQVYPSDIPDIHILNS